ncbi:hypothetical protein GF336_07295 [Candidatus Woesearchaeota archaeon]|nr:hypothetical protein [Candidatus Woesearchaeota archaeon]
MSMDTLMERYFDQIEIEDADFVPIDDAKSYAAYLLLDIPTEMLKEYLRLKGQNRELPDGAEFWKETGLGNLLRNSDKYHGQGHVSHLSDILDYLESNVWGEYQRLNSQERIRLDITEVPEFYDN